MKYHTQIYVLKCPTTYKKHLLNLLKSSMSDISPYWPYLASKLFKSCVKLCNGVYSKHDWKYVNNFILSCIISAFPVNSFSLKCCLYSLEKASALRKFKILMKQPALASFHFKIRQMIRINRHLVHWEKIPTHVRCLFSAPVGPKKHCNVSLLRNYWLTLFHIKKFWTRPNWKHLQTTNEI